MLNRTLVRAAVLGMLFGWTAQGIVCPARPIPGTDPVSKKLAKDQPHGLNEYTLGMTLNDFRKVPYKGPEPGPHKIVCITCRDQDALYDFPGAGGKLDIKSEMGTYQSFYLYAREGARNLLIDARSGAPVLVGESQVRPMFRFIWDGTNHRLYQIDLSFSCEGYDGIRKGLASKFGLPRDLDKELDEYCERNHMRLGNRCANWSNSISTLKIENKPDRACCFGQGVMIHSELWNLFKSIDESIKDKLLKEQKKEEEKNMIRR